ncbi:hypothetical protein MVEN_00097200 [Mycena venus]|uniref:Uncharacterized protein n=1 Tax=Mycena venus TaxID=2733690 RepID=A0A8H7DED7_9AGAR|nr:hypothetical protein MVEN_00097200 [Mycena venus]
MAKPTAVPKPKAAPPKTRTKGKKAADEKVEVIDDDPSSDIKPSKRRQSLNWVKNKHWTHTLAAYLCENPSFHKKLFGDSTAEAKKDGMKETAKDGKAVQFQTLAQVIFEDDPQERACYSNDPSKYALSVETRLWRLKKEYKKHVLKLGATGAGLDPSQISTGSKLASLVDEIRAEWPWWDGFHSFWRELANYNPVGVQSSEPGMDHSGAAAVLFDSDKAAADSEAEANGQQLRDEDGEDDEDRSEASKAGYGKVLYDSKGEDKSNPSSDYKEDADSVREASTPPASTLKRSGSKNSRTGVKKAAKSAVKGKEKASAPAVVRGRDLGMMKAAKASKSSSTAKKNPIERLSNIRESKSRRLEEKRKLQHEEEMECLRIKKKKYDLKQLQAENERLHLLCATSRSPRRHSRGLNLGSPSPLKSRSSRYTPRSPSHSKSRSSRYTAGSPGYIRETKTKMIYI